MRQILLHYLLPLLLPFVVYGVWLWLARRKAGEANEGPAWRDAPWTWLFVSGAGLVAASLVALALFSGEEPGQEYVAPSYIDGEIVPGHME